MVILNSNLNYTQKINISSENASNNLEIKSKVIKVFKIHYRRNINNVSLSSNALRQKDIRQRIFNIKSLIKLTENSILPNKNIAFS